ncbi:MAG TPA: hypothetical protein VGO22_02110 [Pseudorhizobium sp.]|jgi:hypothetical protein|nr:hypothetical protein [Pseudorhizobium sp.]
MQTFQRYSPEATPPGALIVRLYHSGAEIRGYIRQVAEPGTDDTIFPGEEMEPETAFRMAENKNRESGQPVFVELSEGVAWDRAWGELT